MNNVPTEPSEVDALHVLLTKVTKILEQHQIPMSTLRLAAYATDAMRVLRQFEQQASMSKSFDDMLKSSCSDWRNPGSIDDPADLIAMALTHVSMALRNLYAELEAILVEASAPAHDEGMSPA